MATYTVSSLISEVLSRLGEDDYLNYSETYLKQSMISSYKEIVGESLSELPVNETVAGITGTPYITPATTPIRVMYLVNASGNEYEQLNGATPSDLSDYEYCIYNDVIYLLPAPTTADSYSIDYYGMTEYTTSSTSIVIPSLLKEVLLAKVIAFCYMHDEKPQMAVFYENKARQLTFNYAKHKKGKVKTVWNPEYTE